MFLSFTVETQGQGSNVIIQRIDPDRALILKTESPIVRDDLDRERAGRGNVRKVSGRACKAKAWWTPSSQKRDLHPTDEYLPFTPTSHNRSLGTPNPWGPLTWGTRPPAVVR